MPDKSTAPVEAAAPAAATMPLDEYMIILSRRDRRPEIVNAFYATERAAQRLHGTQAQFDARFAAFENAPA